MSYLKCFSKSAKNLSKLGPMCVCAMMLALRIVLGIFTNFTLSFMPFVKIGFSFLPIVIIAYLYGPWCAAIVSGAGDILSIILSNPTSFSIAPGLTICYFLEGLILGVILFERKPDIRRIAIAFTLVLVMCRLPLNTLVLSSMMGIPYLELMIYRSAVLVPFAVVEVLISFSIIKAVDRVPMLKKIK